MTSNSQPKYFPLRFGDNTCMVFILMCSQIIRAYSKASVVVDALSRLSIGSVAHFEEEMKESAKDVHRLACLGVWLTYILDGGVIVQSGLEFSFVTEGRLCVSIVGELRKHILTEAHNSKYSIHPDRGPQFTSHFWKSFQKGVGTQVSHRKGVMRFGKKGKLSPRYVGPYRILKRVGNVAYELELPAELAAVHPVFPISLLKKCVDDSTLIVPLESVAVKESLNYEEVPVEILDRQVRRLRNKEVASMKVLWRTQFVERATWEVEAAMMAKYPHLFPSDSITT
ncbi:hypothetical protein MTR67_018756 [Solanum verrucosum]|uniref:Tf2-1-like SH3-like domain-containing protein n=1 Tax=Solanum verrucosum TaxID=315347 RepID=A0AAF0TMN8_SOLVR|nr:hypothetical protein MTR67_018756 [Solanum verrucosum]